MRYLILFALTLGLLACQKDDNPKIDLTSNALHYDGDNQSAPVLARGISYVGARFSDTQIVAMGQDGKTIKGIEFYVANRPEQIRVLIFDWNANSDTEPGNVLYESTISSSNIDNNQWTRHDIAQSLPIPSTGVWIVLEVSVGDQDIAVIGCDQGPRHPDGDAYGLFDDNNEPGWISFFEFSDNNTSINWNVRGVIE